MIPASPDERRDFARGALAAFAVLLCAAELGARLLVSSGNLPRVIDVSGSLTTLAELRSRARALRGATGLLGDSVAGPTALLQHPVPRARGETPAARPGTRMPISSLSADGLTLPDLEGLAERLGDGAPADVFVLLNFRLFAASFEPPADALSREALLPSSAEDLRAARRSAAPATSATAAKTGDALGRRLYESAADVSRLFLVSQALRARVLAPSRKDVVERSLARLLPAAEDEDLTASLLRLRIAPFYEDRDWNPDSPAFASLRRLLSRRANGAGATVVVLVPQNPGETASLAPSRLAGNRALVRSAAESVLGPRGRFVDLVDALPAGAFLDHCHLTGEGNARLAGELAFAMDAARGRER